MSNQQKPKDLLELPQFQKIKKLFELPPEKKMHQCQLCGNYNFESEMFCDFELGWVDNACLDKYIDECLESPASKQLFEEMTKERF